MFFEGQAFTFHLSLLIHPEVWVGHRNSALLTIRALREALEEFGIQPEIHDRQYDDGKYCLLKTRDVKTAWLMYDFLVEKGCNLGQNTGPTEDACLKTFYISFLSTFHFPFSIPTFIFQFHFILATFFPISVFSFPFFDLYRISQTSTQNDTFLVVYVCFCGIL